MKRSVSVVCVLVASALAQPKYPATKTSTASDTWFGKTYKDPYRWLEDLKNKDVEAWFKSQSDLADGLLDKIPGRDMLAKEWSELDKRKPASYGIVGFEAGRVFYKKTLGGENVGKLYYRVGYTGAEKLLFDPGTYQQGVVTTINSATPSWDGKYVALGLTSGGAEYSEIRILDVAKGTLLADSFYPSYGLSSWTPDSKSFLYDAGNTTDLKSAEIELNRHIRLHVIGTAFDKDRDMFSSAVNPDLDIAPKEFPYVTIDETFPDYLIGGAGTVQQEARLFIAPVADLKKPKIAWKVLAKTSDNIVRGWVFDRGEIYAVVHTGAPKYKVVKTSVAKPDWAAATTVIPEAADSIQNITRSKRYLFTEYSNGVTSRITKLDFTTKKSTELKLPASGTAHVSCPDFRSNRCIVTTTGWTTPATQYDYDGDKDTFAKSVFNTDVTYPGFDQLVSEEVEVKGYDNTMIPLSIIHRKDTKLDGSNPTILTGYGSYGISSAPNFDIKRSLATHGVVLAVAHVRGGSEKGEAWYKAGYKATKPNTWKDFISCAEYLIAKGYTSKAKLAGTGTSAGGILISRAITDRPDLFAAAVCNVCSANQLRAEFSPNGPVNTPEFGTVQNKDEIGPLAEMDGLSHVKPGTKYPALLGVGGWNDPRVSVWEPGKLVAAVQAASTSGKPVLLKINYDNGHFTEEKVVTFKNFANQYAFLLWQTGHKEFQPR